MMIALVVSFVLELKGLTKGFMVRSFLDCYYGNTVRRQIGSYMERDRQA